MSHYRPLLVSLSVPTEIATIDFSRIQTRIIFSYLLRCLIIFIFGEKICCSKCGSNLLWRTRFDEGCFGQKCNDDLYVSRLGVINYAKYGAYFIFPKYYAKYFRITLSLKNLLTTHLLQTFLKNA